MRRIFGLALLTGLLGSAAPRSPGAPAFSPETPVADSGYVKVGDGRLFYRRTGRGHPVVLIGLGGGVDGRIWNRQAAALRDCYRVIRYDARGFGRSDPPRGPYSHWQDLIGILASLGVGKVSVVGLSAGGGVAIDAVVSRPELFDGLIVMGSVLSGYRFSEEFQQREARNSEAAATGDATRVADAWIADPYSMPAATEAARRWYRRLRLDPGNVRVYRAPGLRSPSPLMPPAIGRLGTIAAPTLILTGERDHPDVRAIAELLGRRIAGAERLVVRGAGHLLPLERPDTVSAALRSFLARQHACARPASSRP